jgi:peroxiredoxin
MQFAPLLMLLATAGAVDFELPDALPDNRQTVHRLADFRQNELVAVVFVGTQCPLAKLYAPRLNEIAAQFEPAGLAVVGINPNTHDSASDIAGFCAEQGCRFPILIDAQQRVADQFGATRQLEVFLLDRERKVRYHGRIDDQYAPGQHRPAPSRHDLVAAIEELLAGKPVSLGETEVAGCFIDRAEPAGMSAITYSRHIAPILARHCVECHRTGQIGPFTLTSYQDAVAWADTMRERVSSGAMPPWHADPAYGHFANERRLPDEEKQLLYDWIDTGLAEGNPADLPPVSQPSDAWCVGQPDQIVHIPEPIAVPATGIVEYSIVEMDPGFKTDTWIRSAEVMPGNRKVLHHATVVIAPPSHGGPVKTFEKSAVISGWTPGYMPLVPPPGMARKIPAGWHIYMQLHYVTTGTATTDNTSLGLVFADDVQSPVWTNFLLREDFAIQPFEANQQLEKSWQVPHDILLLSLFPHMHLRGKSFRYEAIYPNGQTEVLLSVPKYDFMWQHLYTCRSPSVCRPAPCCTAWLFTTTRPPTRTTPTPVQRSNAAHRRTTRCSTAGSSMPTCPLPVVSIRCRPPSGCRLCGSSIAPADGRSRGLSSSFTGGCCRSL